MTTTAPPRPPRASDDVKREEVEALIEEARARTQRRRRMYGAAAAFAAASVALAAVGVFMAFDGTAQTPSASSRPVAWPGAPEEEASLVAHFSKLHVGWVFVYADGRVITYPDIGASGPRAARKYTVVEQRLSPTGVELVRSGQVEPDVFLRSAERPLPASAWTDAEATTYVPSKYAVCSWKRRRPVDRLRDAPGVVGRLPASARALLRGKERAYTGFDLFLPVSFPERLRPSVDCFEVTTDEALSLRAMLTDAGFRGANRVGGDHGTFVPLDGHGENWDTAIMIQPLFPHGEWLMWGG